MSHRRVGPEHRAGPIVRVGEYSAFDRWRLAWTSREPFEDRPPRDPKWWDVFWVVPACIGIWLILMLVLSVIFHVVGWILLVLLG